MPKPRWPGWTVAAHGPVQGRTGDLARRVAARWGDHIEASIIDTPRPQVESLLREQALER
jgi:hypothetical protein